MLNRLATGRHTCALDKCSLLACFFFFLLRQTFPPTGNLEGELALNEVIQEEDASVLTHPRTALQCHPRQPCLILPEEYSPPSPQSGITQLSMDAQYPLLGYRVIVSSGSSLIYLMPLAHSINIGLPLMRIYSLS